MQNVNQKNMPWGIGLIGFHSSRSCYNDCSRSEKQIPYDVRDDPDFESLDAEVIGISSDTPESHQGFAEKHSLPFQLASDPHGELRKAFHVPRTLGILPGRTTFVIDRTGIIRLAFSSQFSAAKHVKKAKETLESL